MYEVEFVEDIHTYLVNGVIVPSVSKILRSTIFKDQYKNVPKHILEKAATFGTNVHKAIETDEVEGLSMLEKTCYDQWLKLKNKHKIKVLEQEQIIHFKDLYCGTFDMIIEVDGEIYLNDVKTTYALNKEYLSWQLSLYKLAYENMYDKEIKGLSAIWLPKKKIGQFVKVDTI